MSRREVTIPLYMEEGSLAGAMHALSAPQTQIERLIQETYQTSARAIRDCLSILPVGISYAPSDDGRVLFSQSGNGVDIVRIIEDTDHERGFEHTKGRIKVENRGMFEEAITSDVLLENRWELTENRASATELWVKKGKKEFDATDKRGIKLVGVSVIQQLASIRAEIEDFVK